MKRSTALFWFLIILICGWFVFSNTGIMSALNPATSPVIATTEDGTAITLAMVIWAVIIVFGWLTLAVLGSLIDPYLGYLVLRLGFVIIEIALRKKIDFSPPDKGGGGSDHGPRRVG